MLNLMMNTNMLERFETALRNDVLDGLVRELEAEGMSQVEIYDYFDQFIDLLGDAEREEDEDRMMDTIGRIIGYCSPHAKLFPNFLKDEAIYEFRRNRSAKGEEHGSGVWT